MSSPWPEADGEPILMGCTVWAACLAVAIAAVLVGGVAAYALKSDGPTKRPGPRKLRPTGDHDRGAKRTCLRACRVKSDVRRNSAVSPTKGGSAESSSNWSESSSERPVRAGLLYPAAAVGQEHNKGSG